MSCFTVTTAFADVKTYRKNGYVYTIKDEGVQILHYVGKKSKVRVPSEIDGKRVVKLGFDFVDEYRDEIDLLEYGGFSRNKYVKTVIIPREITDVGVGVFRDCKNLKKVVIHNLTEISAMMFSGCVNLQSITIPKTVTYIGFDAFANCKKLKEISLPSSVTMIDDAAFFQSGLTKFHVGKNVKDISGNAYVGDVFYGTKIKKITVSKNNKKYSAKKGVLYNKNKTTLIYYPCKKSAKSFTIPKTVTKISSGAFSGNKYLKNVVISKNVEKIRENAFSGCQKLTKVKFKNKKKLKIDYSAFFNCKSLKVINIPSNVKRIGSKAFGYYYTKKTFKYKKVKDFTIKGKKDSQAHKYAKKHKFKFVPM